MKIKQVRKGVFETNSSSTHSIVITKGSSNDLIDIPELNENGNLEVFTGEYGWEIVTYHHFRDKVSYAATYALNYGQQFKEMLTEVLKEYTGAKEVIYDNNVESDEWGTHGYIDHQSLYEAGEIFEDRESLINFLFNPGSYFETDNDNH